MATVASTLAVAGSMTVASPLPGSITHNVRVAGSYAAASGFFPVGIIARIRPVRPSNNVAVLLSPLVAMTSCVPGIASAAWTRCPGTIRSVALPVRRSIAVTPSDRPT